MELLATAATDPDLLSTVFGALPDLGSLGGALALVVVVLRWTASERKSWQEERMQWQAERLALLDEARQLRGELRGRDSGSPPSLSSSG
ncbi:hypothetical protein [Pseudonocardia hydrocarbonoxydans]|uniref:Uncharacterized protein n=1 Tax=Pseudonocardia hydrocarbonoxydans TaxID=76726 RepID=A0A4Y3WQC5_9PSEU|nr:hypothetical protein [Pseudonocardia hydrocarbonoxydans]GEC20974.1 hypothetical protein PHY01_32570 [Pseudonocardia hydrocarbonoxydans]